MIGDWREIHDEIHNLYSLLNVIRKIKSRGMGWAGYVARIWKISNQYNIFGWEA